MPRKSKPARTKGITTNHIMTGSMADIAHHSPTTPATTPAKKAATSPVDSCFFRPLDTGFIIAHAGFNPRAPDGARRPHSNLLNKNK